MEKAALTNAHARARNAFHLQASAKASLSAAEQHQAASGEFHKAAEGVEDSEALRILDLLEKHHERLARIVRDQAQRPQGRSSGLSSGAEQDSRDPQHQAATGDSSYANTTPSTTSAPGGNAEPSTRVGRREPASSIAANLASARGIPPQQRRPRQASGAVHGLTDRMASQKASKAPPEATNSSAAARLHDSSRPSDAEKSSDLKSDATTPSSDAAADPFNRFYSTFGGLLSKLSAPLAYAGLPLTPNESPQNAPEQPSRYKAGGHYASASDQPELNELFSKAALKAVREDHASLGAVQESFYVVPTGGGTVSYANILARTDRHARRISADATIHERPEEEDNFVDARESPQASSPRNPRKAAPSSNSNTAGKKTVEELQMENESLKQLTDNLSRRLYMWEKSAQNQTSALQQSIRNLRSSQAPSVAATPAPDLDKDMRVSDLETKMIATQKDLEKYMKENERLKTLVGRYRERWEKLKEGARTRRDGTVDPKSPEAPGPEDN